jgi:radical SAM protein with 4Fe4S-binding SPASM domain
MHFSPYSILPGVFSRCYCLPSGEFFAVAYHTPTNRISSFDGDSAQVWNRIWESKGDTRTAFEYILTNGAFEQDPESETLELLNAFVGDLIQANLLVDTDARVVEPRPTFAENAHSLREIVDLRYNPEQQVSQRLADHHILYALTLEVTYTCNERCSHCYIPEYRDEQRLSVSQIEHLLLEFRDMGGFAVLITGGEPLMRKDFNEILDVVTRMGFVVSLNSNLTLMDDTHLEAIAKAHPKSVGCSIYSADPSKHDAITQIKGSHGRSIDSIRRLRSRGIPVVIKAPLMESTAAAWRDIETLANNLNCEIQYDLNITSKTDGGGSPLSQRVTNKGVLMDVFSNRFYKLAHNDESYAAATTVTPEASLCGAGANSLSVSPDGAIHPCLALPHPLGQFPHVSLKEVWETAPFFRSFGALRLSNVERCSQCDKLIYCNRCPGAWEAETGSIIVPPEYTCLLASTYAEVSLNDSTKGGE